MRIAIAMTALFLLAGCTGPTSNGAGKRIDLHDNHFEDGNFTVAAGASVTYRNEGQRAHTVTIHWVGDPLTTYRLDETLPPGEEVSYTFPAAGTYHVFCRLHGTMTTGMASVVQVT
ncbi:MAG TPA: cupredoxin domain-containing protein [Candidatus Thermoplasmatota archaeon]|nr:cupredoxin domain-containing protein [Candidatus Thermoplasmatota archaeon]